MFPDWRWKIAGMEAKRKAESKDRSSSQKEAQKRPIGGGQGQAKEKPSATSRSRSGSESNPKANDQSRSNPKESLSRSQSQPRKETLFFPATKSASSAISQSDYSRKPKADDRSKSHSSSGARPANSSPRRSNLSQPQSYSKASNISKASSKLKDHSSHSKSPSSKALALSLSENPFESTFFNPLSSPPTSTPKRKEKASTFLGPASKKRALEFGSQDCYKLQRTADKLPSLESLMQASQGMDEEAKAEFVARLSNWEPLPSQMIKMANSSCTEKKYELLTMLLPFDIMGVASDVYFSSTFVQYHLQGVVWGHLDRENRKRTIRSNTLANVIFRFFFNTNALAHIQYHPPNHHSSYDLESFKRPLYPTFRDEILPSLIEMGMKKFGFSSPLHHLKNFRGKLTHCSSKARQDIVELGIEECASSQQLLDALYELDKEFYEHNKYVHSPERELISKSEHEKYYRSKSKMEEFTRTEKWRKADKESNDEFPLANMFDKLRINKGQDIKTVKETVELIVAAAKQLGEDATRLSWDNNCQRLEVRKVYREVLREQERFERGHYRTCPTNVVEVAVSDHLSDDENGESVRSESPIMAGEEDVRSQSDILTESEDQRSNQSLSEVRDNTDEEQEELLSESPVMASESDDASAGENDVRAQSNKGKSRAIECSKRVKKEVDKFSDRGREPQITIKKEPVDAVTAFNRSHTAPNKSVSKIDKYDVDEKGDLDLSFLKKM